MKKLIALIAIVLFSEGCRYTYRPYPYGVYRSQIAKDYKKSIKILRSQRPRNYRSYRSYRR